MKFILSFSLLFFLVGCSGLSKRSSSPAQMQKSVTKEKIVLKFDQGNQLMDKEQFQEAIVVFESAHINNPATTLDSMLLFNLGISYYEVDQCRKAYDTLRKVVAYANKRAPALALRAKLKMAAALGCLGQDSKALVLLIEVYRGRQLLPPAIGEAEVPAQISVLYARANQKKQALQYLKIAEKGLLRISGNLKLMAETLFLMGNFAKMVEENVSWPKFIASYDLAKRYLIRALLLDQPVWSAKAKNTLESGFEKMWSYESELQEKLVLSRSAIEKRSLKVQKDKLLKAMLVQIVRTKNLITPSEKPTSVQKDLEAFLAKEELKIRNGLADNAVLPETTEQADKLNKLKREGQIKE